MHVHIQISFFTEAKNKVNNSSNRHDHQYHRGVLDWHSKNVDIKFSAHNALLE